MSHLVLVRSLVLVLLSLVVLGGCSGGSGGEDSEHGLVPTPETHVTDTNTTPDANGTQPDDSNGTIDGDRDDGNVTGGGDTNNTTGGGNDGNTTGGGDANTTVSLSTLKLTIADTTLNKEHNTTVSLTGTYADGTAKEIADKAQWLVTPQDAIKIEGRTLTALKDVNVTLRAQVGDKLSNPLHLEIYWEVNGHHLPPEPDPQVNNATLLGVDVNHNGVRDDVERWIYKTYDHPIERGIFMQSARAYNKLIVNPKKAHETAKYADNAYSCGKFWRLNNKEFHKKYRFKYMNEELEKIQFNTIKRHIAYERYNGEFNGEVFSSPEANQSKCLFDENGNLKVEP